MKSGKFKNCTVKLPFILRMRTENNDVNMHFQGKTPKIFKKMAISPKL